jgi:hypothetical protein
MSVFVRSTLIFTVALATAASHTIERFDDGDDHVVIVGRALIGQNGGRPTLTQLVIVPVIDPRLFPSAQVGGALIP